VSVLVSVVTPQARPRRTPENVEDGIEQVEKEIAGMMKEDG